MVHRIDFPPKLVVLRIKYFFRLINALKTLLPEFKEQSLLLVTPSDQCIDLVAVHRHIVNDDA